MNPEYRNIISADWLTILLLVSLVLIALGKYFFKSTFTTYLILPFNIKYLTLSKKKGRLFNWFHLLATFFQLFNLSIFIFLGEGILRDGQSNPYPLVFFIVFSALVVFLLTKTILQLGTGYFFENQGTMRDLIFEKLSFFNYSSIMAFCGNVILIYILPGSIAVVYVTIALILLINLIGLINVVRIHQKLILNNIFYFILYLCTLEISPLVLLGSYLND